MAQAARLVVVVPHHSRDDLLPSALAAVAAWPRVVVDDGPPGARAPALPADVVRLRSPGELGFARAVNLGLAHAEQVMGAELVLLVNDDAIPHPGCVEALLAAWGPGVGAVGPVLMGALGVESAGIDHRWWGRVRQRVEVPGAVIEVDALSGACLLVEASSRFDPAFPHGFEDLAFCGALRRRGRRCVLVPQAVCDHLGGGSLDRRSAAAQRHAVAGHLRLVGGGWRTGVVLGLALAQVLREGGPASRLGAIAQGLEDWRGRAHRPGSGG